MLGRLYKGTGSISQNKVQVELAPRSQHRKILCIYKLKLAITRNPILSISEIVVYCVYHVKLHELYNLSNRL